MNPKQFLILGGIILALIGMLGMVGDIIGPTPEESFFGSIWWFDTAENWAHLVLGIVALVAAFIFPAGLQKSLVLLVGFVAVLIGIYSAVSSAPILGANLENPADTVLHMLVGDWAIFAGMRGGSRTAASIPNMNQSIQPPIQRI